MDSSVYERLRVNCRGKRGGTVTKPHSFWRRIPHKPDNYTPVSALVGEEEDWGCLLGYIVNEHLCLDFGYGHLVNY
jgi:hypothetical protein